MILILEKQPKIVDGEDTYNVEMQFWTVLAGRWWHIRAAILRIYPVTHSEGAPIVCRDIFCRFRAEKLGPQFYGAYDGCNITTSYADEKCYSLKQVSYIWCSNLLPRY